MFIDFYNGYKKAAIKDNSNFNMTKDAVDTLMKICTDFWSKYYPRLDRTSYDINHDHEGDAFFHEQAGIALWESQNLWGDVGFLKDEWLFSYTLKDEMIRYAKEYGELEFFIENDLVKVRPKSDETLIEEMVAGFCTAAFVKYEYNKPLSPEEDIDRDSLIRLIKEFKDFVFVFKPFMQIKHYVGPIDYDPLPAMTLVDSGTIAAMLGMTMFFTINDGNYEDDDFDSTLRYTMKKYWNSRPLRTQMKNDILYLEIK